MLPLLEEIEIGDTVTCMKGVTFMDGDRHFIGQRIVVKDDEVHYYNLFRKSYLKDCDFYLNSTCSVEIEK